MAHVRPWKTLTARGGGLIGRLMINAVTTLFGRRRRRSFAVEAVVRV